MSRGINLISIVTLCSLALACLAQESIPAGTLKGKLIDRQTKSPLAGANVMIMNTSLGAATDQVGGFVIQKIPVGAYSVTLAILGMNL